MLSRNYFLHGRYRIIRPLGRGGFGQVYEALDDKLDCIVAIKERRAELSSEKLRRAFEREAKLLANLRHPALPKVMDHFFEIDGQFLVMEFIEGDDLSKLLLKRRSPFTVEEVFPWADELLKALEYLHSRDEPIIHRDIKPSNLKITDQGEIFLLDFGLAKGMVGAMPEADAGHRSSSVHGYTEAYASLEQLNNAGTNEQSDLYSLGATLYHVLTGRPPLTAAQRYHVLEMRGSDPLPSAHDVNPGVPFPLSLVLSRALAMSRKDRLTSATQMRVELTRARLELEERAGHVSEETVAGPREARDAQLMPAGSGSSSAGSPTNIGQTIASPSSQIPPTFRPDSQRPSELPASPTQGPETISGGRHLDQPQNPQSTSVSWPSQIQSEARDSKRQSAAQEEDTLLITGEEERQRILEEVDALVTEADAARLRTEDPLERQRRAEEEARHRAEEEARLAEEEARRLAAEEARLAEAEARRQAEEEARLAEQEALRLAAVRFAEAEARRQAEEKARLAEQEARRRAEEEARLAEEAALRQAEEKARLDEAEARRRAEEEARLAEEEARRQAEEEARLAEQEARRRAEAEARLAEQQARRRAEEKARLAEQEARRQAEEEARLAEHEALRQAAEEARLAEQEARRQAEEKARLAEQEARRQAEEEARVAEEEARRLAAEEARLAEEEARRQAEEEARLAEQEARRQAEEEARVAEQEARRRAAEEARLAEEAARRQAEEEADRQRKEDMASQQAEESARLQSEFLAKSRTAANQTTATRDRQLAEQQAEANRRPPPAFVQETAASIVASQPQNAQHPATWPAPPTFLHGSPGSFHAKPATRRRGLLLGSIAATLIVMLGVAALVIMRRGSNDNRADLANPTQPRNDSPAPKTALPSFSLKQTINGFGGKVWSVTFSRDGALAAAGGEGGKIRVWDGRSWESKYTIEGADAHAKDVNSIAFSPDGRTLASGSSDKTVRLWNAANGSWLKTLSGHQGWVLSVAFSPDGTTLASAGKDNNIYLWDVSTGNRAGELKGHTGEVWSVAFSPDGTTLASAGKDIQVILWDVRNGGKLRELKVNGIIFLNFSPDGQILATGQNDNTIKLWNWHTGVKLRDLNSHRDMITALAFATDGSVLTSASEDKTIKLWDVSTGAVKQTLSGHEASVDSVCFSPDGKTLLSGSRDRTIRVWQ